MGVCVCVCATDWVLGTDMSAEPIVQQKKKTRIDKKSWLFWHCILLIANAQLNRKSTTPATLDHKMNICSIILFVFFFENCVEIEIKNSFFYSAFSFCDTQCHTHTHTQTNWRWVLLNKMWIWYLICIISK